MQASHLRVALAVIAVLMTPYCGGEVVEEETTPDAGPRRRTRDAGPSDAQTELDRPDAQQAWFDACAEHPDAAEERPDATTPGEDAGTPGEDASTAGMDAAQPGPDAGMPMDAATERPDADTPPPPDDGGSIYVPDGGQTNGCLEATGTASAATNAFEDGTERAQVSITTNGCRRTYSLSTNVALRDNLPANPRSVSEEANGPTVRTRNEMFDALYALALAEVRENSVSSIRDDAFNNGEPWNCPPGGCFETGRKWPYVWTRDTSYSVDLGLAPLDPTRVRNSLEFKVSYRRSGGDRQIVQDTGSGGSYPISTDRVTWALGAAQALNFLDGAERTAFRDLAYDAIKNTLEHDRKVAYDPTDGLYFGETSFLDWREQTYAPWTAEDTVHIGMSKALSTNVLHLQAIKTAAALAEEKNLPGEKAKYQGWGDTLRTAIHQKFWVAADKQYSAHTTSFLDPAPLRRYDLLGTALAVLAGVPDATQAKEALASFPHAGKGPPVIWPQQQGVPIYHNRSFWPFVTAYWGRAAKQGRNELVADHVLWSLMRGAALNLSNMENFELVTGKNCLEENGKPCDNWDAGTTSGPKINSHRQLWSVAGYVSVVHDLVFGMEASSQGIRFQPFVTRQMRNGVFANADTLVLNHFPYRGKKITVVVVLPPKGGTTGGAYAVNRVLANGVAVGGGYTPASGLRDTNLVEVYLEADSAPASTMKRVTDTSLRNIFGPKTPVITALAEEGGKIKLTFGTGGENGADIRFHVYRDGALVKDLDGTTGSWTDPDSGDLASRTHCYALESSFVSSGNRSQHSPVQCHWGANRAKVFNPDQMQNVGGEKSTEHGRLHFGSWGDAGHSLTVGSVQASMTGLHLIQVVHGNGLGPINTGITCSVKKVTVEDASNNDVVGEGYLFMPHLGSDRWDLWKDSSFVRAQLQSGRTYRVKLWGDDQAVNMSFFAHFAAYKYAGGASGTMNRANVAEIKVLAIGP